METFATTDPGDIREMPDMLRRTMALARRIAYGALAVVTIGVFGVGLLSLALLAIAVFDANSGCDQIVLDPLSYPSTDMGCDAHDSGEDNKECRWLQRSNSCMR